MTVSVLLSRNSHLEVSVRRSISKPQSLDDLRDAQKVADYRLSLLESQIEELKAEHARAFAKRQLIVRAIQYNTCNPIDKLPLSHLASFLQPKDVCNLAAVCSSFREKLADNGVIMPNISITNNNITASAVCRFVMNLTCSSVVNLNIDARLRSNAHLLYFLSSKASALSNLCSFSITGGTVRQDIQNSLLSFFENLPMNTLQSLHISGITEIAIVGKLIRTQAGSLKSLQVDYLASGHGTDVDGLVLPVMPNLESLHFDVADLSEAPVSVLTELLEKIKNKKKLKNLYIPHVELLRDNETGFSTLLNLIGKEFPGLEQIVLRFHGLSLPLDEIYDLRRSLCRLPAFNISRNFLIAMDKWASWWPPIEKVWPKDTVITGRAVFREQIEFSSFGVPSDRAWLRLPRKEKEFWNDCITPGIERLFKRDE